MDHHHLYYSDYEPNFQSDQLDRIYRRWTVEGKDKLRCTTGSARLIDIPEGQEIVAAVLLSESLAEKIQQALCIAHSYWTTPQKVAAEDKTLFEKEAKAQSWADELEHLIKLTKKKMRKAGGATRQQRGELQKLLEERMKCQKTQEWNQRQRRMHEDTVKLGKERWSNAWFAVQQELDRVWVLAGRVKESQHGQVYARSVSVSGDREPGNHPRSRSLGNQNCDRNRRREARSRSPDRHSQAYRQDRAYGLNSLLGCGSGSRPRSRSRNSRSGNRRREPSMEAYRQARSGRWDRERDRDRSRSFSRWSEDRLYRDMPISPGRSAASYAELNRMAESVCDTSEILRGLLEGVANPTQHLPRKDGNRGRYVQAVESEVAPSSIASFVGQSDGAVHVEDSVTSTAGKAFPVAPLSQQAQDFQAGLRKLASQFDSGGMQPQQPAESSEACGRHLIGSKRKREDQTPSERKLQKHALSRMSDGRISIRDHPAAECVQEESVMQRIAGQTPRSGRLSIRDFFKPGCGTGENPNMSNLDR